MSGKAFPHNSTYGRLGIRVYFPGLGLNRGKVEESAAWEGKTELRARSGGLVRHVGYSARSVLALIGLQTLSPK